MIPWSEAGAGLVMGFFGSVPVAGPVALVVVTRGINRDHAAGRSVAVGAGLGEGILAGVVFAGMGWVVSASPAMAATLDWAGAIVLIAVGAWFALRGLEAPAPQEPHGDDDEDSGLRPVLIGAGMVLGNPGMIGTWGGAVAALEGTGWVSASASGAPAFGLGVAFGVAAWFWMLLAAIKRWSDVLNGKVLALFIRAVGGALVLMGSFASYQLIVQ